MCRLTNPWSATVTIRAATGRSGMDYAEAWVRLGWAFGDGMSGLKPALSVVAPCYNEEASLPEFVRRTTAACQAAVGDDFELILINDGSRDATWACIRALASGHPQIVGLNLSRNHGQQLAVTAG